MKDIGKTIGQDTRSIETSSGPSHNSGKPLPATRLSPAIEPSDTGSSSHLAAPVSTQSSKAQEEVKKQRDGGGSSGEDSTADCEIRSAAPARPSDHSFDEKLQKYFHINRKTDPVAFTTVAEEFRLTEINKVEVEFQRQTFDTFIAKNLPPKEELIKGVLYRRDRISLTGRRREGKTTLLSNIALAGTMEHPDYLGFSIPKPFNVLSFYLEDDPAELQEKLNRMRKGTATERFHLYTIDDFWERNIPIDINDDKFRKFVLKACDTSKPDLVIWDNLGQLVGADYNNSKIIHELMMFMFRLASDYDAAMLISAHPRKASRLNDSLMGTRNIVSLFSSPQLFFEECMGSSHFINSTGSLWGIERDYQTGRTRLLLGAQRFTGDYTRTLVEKKDDDWFERVEDDLGVAKELVLTTPLRRQAWDSLPDGREFSQAEARESVKSALKSNGSFQPWWKELLRHGLLIPLGNTFKKARQKAS